MIRNSRAMSFAWVLMCGLFLIPGCGGGIKVTGKVTYPDGQPLTAGKVVFTDGTIEARGTIESDGTYSMGMVRDGDGIPAGSYKVYIAGAKIEGNASLARKDDEGNLFTPMVDAVDPKFSDPSRSGLTCEVTKSQTFDFSVEKPGAGYSPFAAQDSAATYRVSD